MGFPLAAPGIVFLTRKADGLEMEAASLLLRYSRDLITDSHVVFQDESLREVYVLDYVAVSSYDIVRGHQHRTDMRGTRYHHRSEEPVMVHEGRMVRTETGFEADLFRLRQPQSAPEHCVTLGHIGSGHRLGQHVRPFGPVSLPLEPIRWKVDSHSIVSGIEGCEIHFCTADVKLRERTQHLLPVVLAAFGVRKARQPNGPGHIDELLRHAYERRLRPELQEYPGASRHKSLHPRHELDRLADVPPPVIGGTDILIDYFTGCVRNNAELRRGKRDGPAHF